jgi:hypothetical protein
MPVRDEGTMAPYPCHFPGRQTRRLKASNKANALNETMNANDDHSTASWWVFRYSKMCFMIFSLNDCSATEVLHYLPGPVIASSQLQREWIDYMIAFAQ